VMDEDKFELEVCRLELRYKTMESGWVGGAIEREGHVYIGYFNYWVGCFCLTNHKTIGLRMVQ
jgi:hypothetical protein